MRRITGVLALAAATGSLLGGPARAAGPTVSASFISTAFYRVGAGWIAEANCRTLATPDDPQVAIVATSVTCSVNEVSDTEAMPGAVAVTQVVTATTAPFLFCVSGSATFVDTVTDEVFTVPAGPTCVRFDD
jgi:hypothetical protein